MFNIIENQKTKFLYLSYCIVFLIVTLLQYERLINGYFSTVLIVGLIFLQSIYSILVALIYGKKNRHYKAFLVLAFGFISIFFGEILWNFELAKFFNTDYLLPNILYSIGYIFIFLGFYYEYRASQSSSKILNFIFKFILPVLFFGTFAYLFMTKSNLNNIFNTFYYSVDLLIIFLLVMLYRFLIEYRKGKMYEFWKLIFYGMIFNIVYDVLFSFYSKSLSYSLKYQLINLLWFITYIIFNFAFIYRINTLNKYKEEISLKNKVNKMLIKYR